MNLLTTHGETTLGALEATPKCSIHHEIDSCITRLRPKQNNTVMDPKEMTRALFGPVASGMQSLLKNNTESGEGSHIASVTPLFGNGKDNLKVR